MLERWYTILASLWTWEGMHAMLGYRRDWSASRWCGNFHLMESFVGINPFSSLVNKHRITCDPPFTPRILKPHHSVIWSPMVSLYSSVELFESTPRFPKYECFFFFGHLLSLHHIPLALDFFLMLHQIWSWRRGACPRGQVVLEVIDGGHWV